MLGPKLDVHHAEPAYLSSISHRRKKSMARYDKGKHDGWAGSVTTRVTVMACKQFYSYMPSVVLSSDGNRVVVKR